MTGYLPTYAWIPFREATPRTDRSVHIYLAAPNHIAADPTCAGMGFSGKIKDWSAMIRYGYLWRPQGYRLTEQNGWRKE